MMKTNKQNCQMLLFCRSIGLSIEYDEDNNTFQFHELPVYDEIAQLFVCACVCINDIILFFGGWSLGYAPNSVHKYSIRENKWMAFEKALPSSLRDCTAVLSEDNHIHIIGGSDDEWKPLFTHINAKVCVWDASQL
ncbi:hypothetical protein RFI_34815, partial [Reticulomyxa filosa]